MTSNAFLFNGFFTGETVRTALRLVRRSSRLLLPILLASVAAPFVLAQAGQPTPSADQIVRSALKRQELRAKHATESVFSFDIVTVSETLAKDGSAKETTTKRHRSIPILGRGFERLVQENGRSLSASEEDREDTRQEAFRRDQEKGLPAEPKPEKMSFDSDLASKYNFSLESVEVLDGRRSYVLSYAPRSDDLPVKRRIDRALNKAAGKIWIDVGTYDVARVTFDLQEKIWIGWGLVGTISELKGQVDSRPVEGDYWHPRKVELQLNGRIFFTSLHRRETIRFSGFERMGPEPAPSSPQSSN